MKEIVKYVRFYNTHIRVCKYIMLISVIILIKFAEDNIGICKRNYEICYETRMYL